MAGTTVNTEALGAAAAALDKYIADVSRDIQRMKDAATDCSDNMDKDVYSTRAINNMNQVAKDLQKALKDAEELKKIILATKRKIEST